MKILAVLLTLGLSISTTGAAAADADPVPVTIHTESPILTFPGVTLGYGTGELIDGVLTYDLVYLIDMGELAQATLVSSGTIVDGEPPTNHSSASACSGAALVCDPIELDVLSEITFVSGGPLNTNGATVLTTPPSASGNSAATTWTITAGDATAVPVSVTALVEYPESAGTAVGTGVGELLGGVLTYEMEYVLDLSIFEPTTMTIHGTLFDGAPPTGLTRVSACDGSPLVCEDLELDAFRPENFESGGPFSETDVTILTTATSASGRTPPSTVTITPLDNGEDIAGEDEPADDDADPVAPDSDETSAEDEPADDEAEPIAAESDETAGDEAAPDEERGDDEDGGGSGWIMPVVIVALLLAGGGAYLATTRKA